LSIEQYNKIVSTLPALELSGVNLDVLNTPLVTDWDIALDNSINIDNTIFIFSRKMSIPATSYKIIQIRNFSKFVTRIPSFDINFFISNSAHAEIKCGLTERQVTPTQNLTHALGLVVSGMLVKRPDGGLLDYLITIYNPSGESIESETIGFYIDITNL
tara:strand:- start:114 stop:590 length:477 start_codon:yes stop_codon:yes gene_type:complete